MKVVELAVRRPVAVVMAVLAVILLGGVAFNRLAIDLLPRMNIPVAAVMTSYEGAGPQEVEQVVTQPIEEAVATVENVKRISSVSQPGTSMVMVTFNWGTDMDVATQDIRAKIDYVKQMLPRDVKSPMVLKYDPSMMPVAVYGLSGRQTEAELKHLAEKVIKPRLERIEGVASAYIYGGREREIRVLLDPEKMEGYGVSVPQVVQALQGANLELSGGTVQEGSKEYLVRIPGAFFDLKDIEGVVVYTAAGAPVRLLDFARVGDGFKDVTMAGRLDRRDSIGIVVQKQPTANTVEVMRGVRREIAGMERELPGNLKFRVAFDQASFIEDSIRDLTKNVIAGAVLAAFIIYLFLGSLRSTLIICTAIPVAFVGACMLIYFSGETLNMMTLGGLALGVGMIVDDAIVVLENIYRHRGQGAGAINAAVRGASEVGGAVIGATLTSVAVFIPVIFVTGLTSELFTPLSLTVAFALGASLFVALTLVPMLASRLLRDGPSAADLQARRFRLPRPSGAWLERVAALYRTALKWGLEHRRRTVLIAGGAFVASLVLVPLVGVEFLPPTDQGQVSVTLRMPRGTSLAETDRVVARIEREAAQLPEVETIFASIGAGSHEARAGFGGAEPDRAMIDLLLVDRGKRERSAAEVADDLRRRLAGIPGAEIKVEAPAMMLGGGLTAAPVEVILKGDDLDTLKSLADRAAAEIAQVPGVRDLESSLEEGRPEARVVVDRERAAARGLSVAAVASGIRSAVQGEVATRYRVEGTEIDVRVRLQKARESLIDLKNVTLMGPAGPVRLRDVAEVRIAEGPVAIQRRDQARAVSITANLAGRDLNSVMQDIRERLGRMALPPGYRFEYGGEAQEMAESFGTLGTALVLAVLLVYMILAIQFESLGQPLALMLSVPVAVTGMVLGLLLTRRTFNVPAFIGVIVAVGVVVKNAIVLIDYINQLRARGLERDEAIMQAGPIRLRPVLMTAGTTILAMLPLALGIGEGAELEAPLATVVVGGLLLSTVVSLVLVPVVYAIFDDWGRAVARRLGAVSASRGTT
ncbi:MAG: efflux RND transporter permease subunit [Desulfotomaculales bacterium]